MLGCWLAAPSLVYALFQIRGHALVCYDKRTGGEAVGAIMSPKGRLRCIIRAQVDVEPTAYILSMSACGRLASFSAVRGVNE